MYANIIIDISHEKVDKTFQYKIPEAMKSVLEEGMCVQVPFGAGNRLRTGYVLERTEKAEFPPEKMKEIGCIVKDGVSVEADAVKLAAWIKKTYGCTMIAALKTVLPVKQVFKQKEKKKIVRKADLEVIRSAYGEALRKKQHAKVRVLSELLTEPVLPYELVSGKLHVAAATLKSLQNQELIQIESESYYRNPVKPMDGEEEKKTLSDAQAHICDSILADYTKGIRKTYLIHGITGSGKTQVYLSLIEEVIKQGKQCIVLIPEIALTYQTLLRFYKRFGDRVSVMNSTLTAGEKYDQCERAKRGEIDVIIGPRSALFVPFPNLGLVVIDEEHEGSYKSEMTPRYHAREVAEYLTEIKGASLVLGSATPSLESYYRAKEGKYQLFRLTERLTGGSLANTSVVDLREELRSGNRSIFSRKLQELMEDRLAKKEQIILFLNRRGYAGFISCRSCGYVMKCPHCDVSLSQHKGGRMVCHYCGYETAQVTKCPSCSSPYILGFKAGTQQIEEQIHQRFPQARVLRMDKDTTKKKDSYEEILSAFSEEQADILVGTQMIVKGHDFPKVTLVGVLAADLSLNDSDYRCAERTFQLLTQAAGRAGRGKREGEAVIQTYRPEHYSVLRASEQDYEAFYEEEILYRELAGYPPAAHMLAILITAKEERAGIELAEQIAAVLREQISNAGQNTVQLIGPAKATVGKINDIYRFVIYLKYKDAEILYELRKAVEEFWEQAQRKNETVQFDFDPIDSY
ncbi:MAG: primosomal protein N' [Lachnospiraceae bacterium]|nr:primosomal protein N' [Lachnospiraceae bacterium]